VDGVSLLISAAGAGLELSAKDERLAVRGPRRAAELARRITERKAEVLALLAASQESARAAWPRTTRDTPPSGWEAPRGCSVRGAPQTVKQTPFRAFSGPFSPNSKAP
jgi:hypothetical protein